MTRLIDNDSSLITSLLLDANLLGEEEQVLFGIHGFLSVQRNLHRPSNPESEIRLLVHAVHANHACDNLPTISRHLGTRP